MEKNVPRDLEEINDYDTFLILYFNKDCIYENGFKNDYRNGISFIINRENNTKLRSKETLIIYKDFGIEIHFNEVIKTLFGFFYNYKDNIYPIFSIN